MKPERNGKFWKRTQHEYPDDELISGVQLSELLGVSSPAVTKAKKCGRIDTFEDSHGNEMYHKVVSVQQWQLTKDRRKVTTPTTAQRKMGFDNLAAQATANDFNFDLPRGANGEPLPNSLKLDTVDMGQVIQERQELEVSKAELAQQNARIAKIKADMLEGKLVDKALAFNRVYSLAAEAQDKIVSTYAVLAPKIVGLVAQVLTANGFDEEKVRTLCAPLDHDIGEMIRKENLHALRSFTESVESQNLV